jgi:ribosomal protein S18 acetylase RimI-like enzyme
VSEPGAPLADEVLGSLLLRSLTATEANALGPGQLSGFFEGWPAPPSPARHRDLLAGSAAVEVCLDPGVRTDAPPVVGFLTALTDGVLHLHLPLLEVLPAYRGRGIARRLVERMLARFPQLYAVDLVCDPELVPFYERLGLRRLDAMALRRYEHQAGDAASVNS